MSTFKDFIDSKNADEVIKQINKSSIDKFNTIASKKIEEGVKGILGLPAGITREDAISHIKSSNEDFLNTFQVLLAIVDIVWALHSTSVSGDGTWKIGANALQNEKNPTWQTFMVENKIIAESVITTVASYNIEKDISSGSLNTDKNTLYIYYS